LTKVLPLEAGEKIACRGGGSWTGICGKDRWTEIGGRNWRKM